MAAWKLAPALAAGCSGLLKPAEQTPLTAIRLAELATEAGVPAGVLNIVPGLGETTGQAIGRHPDIDVVSFTGSTEVGGYFLRYSGESNLKVVGLEMGGKSPSSCWTTRRSTTTSIELRRSAPSGTAARTARPTCASSSTQDARRVRRAVVARAKQFKLGDPLDPATELACDGDREHQDRVLGYIDKGRSEEGARSLYGGSRTPARRLSSSSPPCSTTSRPR